MDLLGHTLERYQMQNIGKFSFKTVNQIGIKVLTLLEQLHSIGFVYNDLKPDNICIGDSNKNFLHELKLIDFGLATPFRENIIDSSEFRHVIREHKSFCGNLAFSSKNAFHQ